MIIEQLSSLPDDTSALEPWTLRDGEVRELTRAMFRARAGLEELGVRLAAAADDRGLARADGCTSTTAWLAQITGIAKPEASRLVGLARTVTAEAERTRAAWSRGEITTEQARIIAEAITALPDWFGSEERADAEQVMLQNAPDLTTADLQRLGNHVVEVLDPDGAEEIIGKQLEDQEKRAYDGTQLHLRDAGHGVTRIKGQIPTAQAGMLRTALEAFASPRRTSLADSLADHGEPALGSPSHAQRMGRALLELIEHLPVDKLPQAGGLAAIVTVETTLEALRTALGRAGLTCGTEISASQARRMACNAALIPVVMGGESKILDLTQAKRLHDLRAPRDRQARRRMLLEGVRPAARVVRGPPPRTLRRGRSDDRRQRRFVLLHPPPPAPRRRLVRQVGHRQRHRGHPT